MITLVVIGIFLALVLSLVLTNIKPSENSNQDVKENNSSEYLAAFSIAGINRHKCQLKHVGAFMGKLVEDPDNEFDPNAIMVMHEDGSHLGFIKAAETAAVRNYLGNGFEEYPCVGFIKFVEQYDEDKDDGADEYENTGFFVGRIYIDSELEE